MTFKHHHWSRLKHTRYCVLLVRARQFLGFFPPVQIRGKKWKPARVQQHVTVPKIDRSRLDPWKLRALPFCFHTLNICLTFCRGRLTLSLWRSCRTSLMLRLPSPFLSASVKVCFSHLRTRAVKESKHDGTRHSTHFFNLTFFFSKEKKKRSRFSSSRWRILVSGALPFGQAVLVADAGHQIFQAGDPSSSLLSGSWHKVQGLHVFSIVETEAAVGVKAALCIALENLRLLALTHLPDGVDGNWRGKQTNGYRAKSCRALVLFYSPWKVEQILREEHIVAAAPGGWGLFVWCFAVGTASADPHGEHTP